MPLPLRPGYLAGGLLLAVLAFQPAYSGGDGQCAAGNPSPVRFEADVQPILNQRCVMCHLTGSENGQLNMEPGLAYKDLVGAPSSQSPLPRVTPGAPERSYLVHKLNGTHVKAGGTGTQMPPDGASLDADEIARIVSWIKDCAPNN